MSGFDKYEAPERLEDALALLAEYGDCIRPIAGGTDVLVRLKRGGIPAHEHILLNLKNIPELKTIEIIEPKRNGGPKVRVGAAVTARTLERDEKIRANVPVLAAVANKMASPQVRASATIGGNVANASPAADLAIPLLLLDAEVETARLEGGGDRSKVVFERVPVEDFFTGPGETTLPKGALVTALCLPCPDPDGNTRFVVKKGGVRPAMECAVVSAGCGIRFDAGGAVLEARVAFGAVAPTPVRAHGIETFLAGKRLSEENVEKALALVEAEIDPISDVRGTREYRIDLTKALLRMVLEENAG